jgi:hypothetical protein
VSTPELDPPAIPDVIQEIFRNWKAYLAQAPDFRMNSLCSALRTDEVVDSADTAACVEFLAALATSGVRRDRHARFVLYDDDITRAFARELATVTGKDRDAYRPARGANRRGKRDIYMVLRTEGGDPDAAYVAMRFLQRAFREVHVAVMEQAVSAGTLFLLGADRVHLGPVAILGPLDFQVPFRYLLGEDASMHEASNRPGSVEEIMEGFEEVVRRRREEASQNLSGGEWWNTFLLNSGVKVEVLGHCVRLRAHSKALAVRLLNSSSHTLGGRDPEEIADALVRSYHGHGFAVDPAEAKELLGPKVQVNTPFARLADTLAESFWVARELLKTPIRLLTYEHDPAIDIGPDASYEDLCTAFASTAANPFNRFFWEARQRSGSDEELDEDEDEEDDLESDDDLDEEDE